MQQHRHEVPQSKSASSILPAKKIKLKKNNQLNDNLTHVSTPIRIKQSQQQQMDGEEPGGAGHHPIQSNKLKDIAKNKISLPRLKESRFSDPVAFQTPLVNIQVPNAQMAIVNETLQAAPKAGGHRLASLQNRLPGYLQISTQLTPDKSHQMQMNTKTPQPSSMKQVQNFGKISAKGLPPPRTALSTNQSQSQQNLNAYQRTEQIVQQAQQNMNLSASPSSFNPNQNPAFIQNHQQRYHQDLNTAPVKQEVPESPQRDSLFNKLDIQLSEQRVKKSFVGNFDEKRSDSRSTGSKQRKRRNSFKKTPNHSMTDMVTPQRQSKVNKTQAKSGLGSSYKNSTGNKGSSKKSRRGSRSSEKSINRRSQSELNTYNEAQNNARSKHNRKSNKTSYEDTLNSMGEQQHAATFESSMKRAPLKDQSRSQLNLDLLSKSKLLSECENSLEFILVSFCRAFEFQNGRQAFDFVSGGGNSKYSQCFQDMQNFSKINQFLRLLFTNLKSMIRILESENDHQNVKYHGSQYSQQQNSSQQRIMNLLSMGLSRSVDHRIVWQTCILLSGIFQNVNGIQINYGFQTLMIRWALNQNDNGEFRGPCQGQNGQQQYDFIQSCLIARQRHQELNNVIIDLLYEVANMGRSKRKLDRQNDNSQLVELFSIILPKYFDDGNIHEYFDLMHDLLESHQFQIEKERIDKQHLLFKIIDKCLFHLSIINEVQDPRNPQTPEDIEKLHKSVNTRQSCMSLLCSIWSNNQQIFRQTLNKFIAHFVQLFKSHMELQFDYNEYQLQTKVGKIVLLLLKRNLKDQNKLIKITTFSQLFRLLDQFTQREENDLQSVVFKLLVLQLSEQFQKQSVKDCLDVREIVSNYLGLYIERNEKANISFLVDTIKDYGKQYLQKFMVPNQESQNSFPLFNLSDYFLMTKIIYHPRTNANVAGSLLDFFKFIVLTDKFYDYSTLNFVLKFIVKLSAQFPKVLLSNLKSLFQSCCFLLTKLDIQILRLQNLIKKDLKHNNRLLNECLSLKDILKYSRIGDKGSLGPAHEQLSNLVLKRHIVFSLALRMVAKSSMTPEDQRGLRFFAIEFLGKHLEKPNSSQSLDFLYKQLKVSTHRSDSSDTQQLRQTSRFKQLQMKAKIPLMGIILYKNNQEKHKKMTGVERSLDQVTKSHRRADHPSALNASQVHMQTMQTNVHMYKSHLDMPDAQDSIYQDNLRGAPRRENPECKSEEGEWGGTIVETQKFVCHANARDINFDMEDQSSQTTLRTEIYTSEDEEEMMKYYEYIASQQQRPGKSKTFRSARSAGQKQQNQSDQKKNEPLLQNQYSTPQSKKGKSKQIVPQIKHLRIIADSPVEQTENNATIKNSEAVISNQTLALKRSVSSQFQQSIKIMDEKPVFIKPPKIPIAIHQGENDMRPALLQRQNEAFARKRRMKNKKTKNLRRQQSHSVVKQGDQNLSEQRQLPPTGISTEREIFQNRLPLKLGQGRNQGMMQSDIMQNYSYNSEARVTDKSMNISIVNQADHTGTEDFITQNMDHGNFKQTALQKHQEKSPVLRADPNSNYMLKAKYVTQDLIPEESNEMSSKQILPELHSYSANALPKPKKQSSTTAPAQQDQTQASGKISQSKMKELLKAKKNQSEFANMIHPTSNPNVMIISSKRGVADSARGDTVRTRMSAATADQQQVPQKEQRAEMKNSKNVQLKLSVKSKVSGIGQPQQSQLMVPQSSQKVASQQQSEQKGSKGAVNLTVKTAPVADSNTHRQKILPKDPNSGVIKKPIRILPSANIAIAESPKQQQPNDGLTRRSIQNSKPDILVGKGKKSWRGSQYNESQKSNQGSVRGENQKMQSAEKLKESILVQPQEIQQINKDIQTKNELAQQNQAEREREIKQQKEINISEVNDKEQTNNNKSDKAQIIEPNIKKDDQDLKIKLEINKEQLEGKSAKNQPLKIHSAQPSQDRIELKSQGGRIESTSKRHKSIQESQVGRNETTSKRKKSIQDVPKTIEKSRSRISNIDGNGIGQSMLDSLNDRGDSTEQAITPIENNLQIEETSPLGIERVHNQDAFKSEIIFDKLLKTEDEGDPKSAVEDKPVLVQSPQKNVGKVKEMGVSAPVGGENTPKRVNEQIRKLLHHDEEAEKVKNATIYQQQLEKIMAQSQYDEEKSFKFKMQAEKKDPIDSTSNISKSQKEAKQDARTPQQNKNSWKLDFAKKEKVDADQSASQVNIPAVDSPHSESRTVSKSPSGRQKQNQQIMQQPLNFEQSPQAMQMQPYGAYNQYQYGPTANVQQDNHQYMNGPQALPGQQHQAGYPNQVQNPQLYGYQPGAMGPPVTPTTAVDMPPQGAAGMMAPPQNQFNYNQFMAQMQYLQQVQNDLMVKLKHLESMKQQPANAPPPSMQTSAQQQQQQYDVQTASAAMGQQPNHHQIQPSISHPSANTALQQQHSQMLIPRDQLPSFTEGSQQNLRSQSQPSQYTRHNIQQSGAKNSRQEVHRLNMIQSNGYELPGTQEKQKPAITDACPSPHQKSEYNVKVNTDFSKSYMEPLRIMQPDDGNQNPQQNTASKSPSGPNTGVSKDKAFILKRKQFQSSKHVQSALSTRSFVSSMTQQNRFQNTVAPAALSQYFDHQKRGKKKRKVLKEFKETLKNINPSADQLETMSQKVSQRIQNLRKKKEEKDRMNASQLGSQTDKSVKRDNGNRRLSNLSHLSNNLMSQNDGGQFLMNAPRQYYFQGNNQQRDSRSTGFVPPRTLFNDNMQGMQMPMGMMQGPQGHMQYNNGLPMQMPAQQQQMGQQNHNPYGNPHQNAVSPFKLMGPQQLSPIGAGMPNPVPAGANQPTMNLPPQQQPMPHEQQTPPLNTSASQQQQTSQHSAQNQHQKQQHQQMIRQTVGGGNMASQQQALQQPPQGATMQGQLHQQQMGNQQMGTMGVNMGYGGMQGYGQQIMNIQPQPQVQQPPKQQQPPPGHMVGGQVAAPTMYPGYQQQQQPPNQAAAAQQAAVNQAYFQYNQMGPPPQSQGQAYMQPYH